ncbi:MAG TPA: TylF/MycF/NovP-related O-methyltransferase [Candidatus Paceibacterota bacterium]|nr:TylF/MycF/NovP-related O-methyltransferase [Candidatus Paceibacterota bacterium]
MTLRSRIKRITPWPLHYLYRKLYYFPKDVSAATGFLFHPTKSPTTFGERLSLIGAFYAISYYVDCPHTENELLTIARRILNLGEGVPGAIIEAGAFHGGSTAKLSLVAKLCGRKLHTFDSFEGMPENAEVHGKSIYGREHHFPKGSHAVPLDEVRENVRRFGDASRVEFHKGFFSDTMPLFHETVAVACVNVDLVRSTKDCLRFLYPLTSRGGIIFSQDAHFPWIIELLQDDQFWKKEIGIEKPRLEGIGLSKLVAILRT